MDVVQEMDVVAELLAQALEQRRHDIRYFSVLHTFSGGSPFSAGS